MNYEFILQSATRKDGTRKLVLKVTHQRLRRHYTVLLNHGAIYINESDFSKLATSSKKRLKAISDHLTYEKERIETILSRLTTFTFEAFKREYEKGDLLSDCFQDKADELRLQNKFSSAIGYECAMRSFKNFREVKIHEVDIDYVNQYINYMPKYPASYLRNLRHILRRNGNNTKFSITGKTKSKTPLNEAEIALLHSYATVSPSRQRAVDLWLMSYYGGGMNIKDWVGLRHDDIIDDVIFKDRSKTDEPMIIPITEDLKRLMLKYRSFETEYYFDFIDHTLKDEALHIRYNTFLNNMRRALRQVAKDIGLTKKLTPYVARHSHANVLLNKGASMEQIKDSLGQKDIQSTKAYIGSMNIQKRLEIARLLKQKKDDENTD